MLQLAYKGASMKQSVGKKPLIYPMPVLMIATYNDDGTVDLMNAAWGSVADYEKIAISLAEEHLTYKNILRNKAFTVAIGIKEYVTECDYVGIVSGNQIKDKFEKSGLHASKSDVVNAPIIDEFPLVIECTLSRVTEEGLVIGDIVDTKVDDSIIKDGKIDLSKFHPITYDTTNHTYISLGEVVGKAFHDGLSIKNK